MFDAVVCFGISTTMPHIEKELVNKGLTGTAKQLLIYKWLPWLWKQRLKKTFTFVCVTLRLYVVGRV